MTSLQLALLLAAAAGAASTALAAALALLFYRGRGHRPGSSGKRQPPELPLSLEPAATKPGHRRRHRLALLLLTALCSGRWRRARARVEPAAAAASSSSNQQTDDEQPSSPAAEEEEAWPWRERCFGPASRALYTIYEEEPCPCDDAETERKEQEEARREEQAEVETPYYTPPASPPPPLHCSVASASIEDRASDTYVCFDP